MLKKLLSLFSTKTESNLEFKYFETKDKGAKFNFINSYVTEFCILAARSVLYANNYIEKTRSAFRYKVVVEENNCINEVHFNYKSTSALMKESLLKHDNLSAGNTVLVILEEDLLDTELEVVLKYVEHFDIENNKLTVWCFKEAGERLNKALKNEIQKK